MESSLESLASLAEALASFAWPIIVGLLVWKAYPAILAVLKSRAFCVKYGDAELAVQDSTDELRHVISDLQNKIVALQSSSATATAQVSSNAPEPEAYVQGNGRLILWVDDRPGANAFGRAKFHEDGFRIVHSISTADALQKLNTWIKPDVIISDMERVEDGVRVSDAGNKTYEGSAER